MHNATAITTGSANQWPNAPCIRLWIDLTFRGLGDYYTDYRIQTCTNVHNVHALLRIVFDCHDIITIGNENHESSEWTICNTEDPKYRLSVRICISHQIEPLFSIWATFLLRKYMIMGNNWQIREHAR